MTDAPATEGFEAQNDLERALLEAKDGRMPSAEFVRRMLASTIYILSGEDPGGDGRRFAPLFYPRPETGERMLAVYSAPLRVGEDAERAPFMMGAVFGDFVQRLPQGIGIVLNPGAEFGFELLPPAVAHIQATIRARLAN